MLTQELSSSGIPDKVTATLMEIYRKAADDLKDKVIFPRRRSESAQEFNRARSSMLLSQIDRIVVDLKKQAASWIGKGPKGSELGSATLGPIAQAVKDGVKLGNKQAAEVGVRPKGSALAGSFSLIDRRTIELFARDIAADLYDAADSMGNQAKHVLRATAQEKLSESDIDKILAGGVIEGKPTQTIRQLRESLRAVHGDKVVIIDKNGDPIHFDVGYYASLVARTKTRQATVTARHQRLESLGLNLVSIVGLVSKNFCTAYLGMVFSLDGKSDKYPELSSLPGGGPPFHPLCSKSTRPFVEELASDRQQEQADGVDDADKLIGVDAATAQRRFKDLQLYQAVKSNYATTAKELFGKKAA